MIAITGIPFSLARIAASTGASAGISWLMDGNINHIYGAIENMIADLSGMICDGAKAGCALKLSSAASAAVQDRTYAACERQAAGSPGE